MPLAKLEKNKKMSAVHSENVCPFSIFKYLLSLVSPMLPLT